MSFVGSECTQPDNGKNPHTLFWICVRDSDRDDNQNQIEVLLVVFGRKNIPRHKL